MQSLNVRAFIDGKKFAMLETTVDATAGMMQTVDLSNFWNRTFLLRRVKAFPIIKKNNLGNSNFAILYDGRSSAQQISSSANVIKGSFNLYLPELKIMLGEKDKVKKVKKLEAPKKPEKVYVC